MFKMLAIGILAALVTACAAPAPGAASDPMHASRGSTPVGASKAAELGFHGPADRDNVKDGPD